MTSQRCPQLLFVESKVKSHCYTLCQCWYDFISGCVKAFIVYTVVILLSIHSIFYWACLHLGCRWARANPSWLTDMQYEHVDKQQYTRKAKFMLLIMICSRVGLPWPSNSEDGKKMTWLWVIWSIPNSSSNKTVLNLNPNDSSYKSKVTS